MGEDEEEYERRSCAEDLSSEDGGIESLEGQEPGPNLEIRRKKDLRIESPRSCPEASSRDRGMEEEEEEEEGEEDDSVEIVNISTETPEVGKAKESQQRIERGLRAGRRFTGIPIHDR